MPEPAQTEDVLEDGPGGPALTGVAGDHAGEEDPHANASSSSFSRIRSESKYSSARPGRRWRAARSRT